VLSAARNRPSLAAPPTPAARGCLRKAGGSPLPPSSSPEDRARRASSQESRVSGPEGRGAAPDLDGSRAGATIMARRGAGGARVSELKCQENLAGTRPYTDYVSTATHSNRPDLSHFLDTGQFVSLSGTAVAYSHFQTTFHNAVLAAGIGSGSATSPQIHHLRHSFAVRTLLGWYRSGLDVEALLPRLSTYLGHREPRFTYRYLSATPELLGQAVRRLETQTMVQS